jgi:hypothetical protein
MEITYLNELRISLNKYAGWMKTGTNSGWQGFRKSTGILRI